MQGVGFLECQGLDHQIGYSIRLIDVKRVFPYPVLRRCFQLLEYLPVGWVALKLFDVPCDVL